MLVAFNPITNFTMPPKHRLGEDKALTAEETPQKRRKHDTMPLPRNVVDDMEQLMRVINSVLPKEYAMLPVISKIPRDSLKPRVSTQTVLDQLEAFKQFCQASIEDLPGEQDLKKISRFILRFVAPFCLKHISELRRRDLLVGQSAFKKLILKADGTHALLPVDGFMS
jgi:hypothetical protein